MISIIIVCSTVWSCFSLVYVVSNGGSLQVGCVYAWKIVYDASKEILDIFLIQWLWLANIFIVAKILKIFDFVDFFMWPLDPTSKGTKKHLYPLSSRSVFNEWYLIDFLKCAASAFQETFVSPVFNEWYIDSLIVCYVTNKFHTILQRK